MPVAQVKAGNAANYINQLWSKYIPYWPVFLLILAACLAVAWYKIKISNPVYLSSTSIMIKEKKKGPDETKVIESLNPLLTPEKVIENEIEILQSRSLMMEVVKNLNLYAPISDEGKFIKHSAFKTSPVAIIARNPDSLIYSKEIFFKVDMDKSQVSFQNRTYDLNSWIQTGYGDLKFIPNKLYDGSENKKLSFQIIPPKNYSSALSGKLDIKPINKSSAILSLEISDEVPERAESILNELVAVYNKDALKDKNITAQRTLNFVEGRLNGIERELDSIEKVISSYKARSGAVDISAEGKLFLENVSSTDQKLSDVNLQLSVLNQVESYVKSKDNVGGIVPSTLGIENDMLSKLLTKLYDAELQKEQLKKSVPENNPTMVSINDEINKIRPSILESINNQRQALEANKNTLQSTSGLYSSMLQTIPQKERQLIDISRDHAIKSSIYTFLLQKREETALSYATQAEESRVIDEASTSKTPLSPNPARTYLNACLIGFLISISLISGKEMLNKNVLFRHEIESATSLPIISEIAFDKSTDPLIPQDGKNTVLASQFRKLRSSLGFLGINSMRKKILITSTISGEGKSFIAANLGLSLASTGKKVILLEFDMINPSLSEKFNIHEMKGLSNFIKGETEPEEIIKRSAINENLFIISSGPIPSNPSEMILSSKVEDLLNYLDRMFDYIVIDTAPVGPITDAYVLSSYCDATLYVIRHKYTPKRFIQRIDEESKIHPLKNAAIVFNGIRSRGFTKNSYGMGYGYGHEYIYEGKKGNGKKYMA